MRCCAAHGARGGSLRGESRGALRTLSIRAFGEGADEKYWEKGNLLMLRAVMVRPDEKCLKVTEEAIIEVLEKEPKWKLPKNAKARSERHRTR